jgi:hypothetical protein
VNAHALLRAALDTLVAGGYHPNTFPQEDRAPTWPAIRGTIITAQAFTDQCGDDAGETDDETVQLDVVAVEYDEMKALAGDGGTVRLALLSMQPPAFRAGYFETFDRETKTHRGVLTYVFKPSSDEPGSP